MWRLIFPRLIFAIIYFRGCSLCHILRGFIFADGEISIILHWLIFANRRIYQIFRKIEYDKFREDKFSCICQEAANPSKINLRKNQSSWQLITLRWFKAMKWYMTRSWDPRNIKNLETSNLTVLDVSFLLMVYRVRKWLIYTLPFFIHAQNYISIDCMF